ncbi:MAG TPA: hypothetical protein VIU35_03635 [Chitinophagaceae bacterium]
MKYLFLILLCLFINSQANSQNYPGTNVRGRVVTYYYQQQVPLTSAKVDLYFFDPSRAPGYQWVFIASTLTDAYGFYFFNGVNPNIYTIWVNQVKSYNIQVLFIDYRYYSYQDLPQFIF